MTDKQFDFAPIAKGLRETALQLAYTERATWRGEDVALLVAKGTDVLSKNLLTLAEWLGRLEEYLNCQSGCSEVPVLPIDPPSPERTADATTT